MLDDPGLTDLVVELGRRFGWDDSLKELVPDRRWGSHTSDLYRLSRPDGSARVVLKVGRGWTPGRAEEVYHDLRGFRSHLESAEKVRAAVPRVLGWHHSPPSLCVAYVEGEDLGRLLRRRDGYRSPAVEKALEECGGALGLFHSKGKDQVPGDDEARERVARMARQLLLKPSFLQGMDLDQAVSRRYGDFAPYNVRLTEDGGVWILDHPSPPSFAPVHRDAAWFLFNLERRLGWSEPVDPRQLQAARERLGAAFLAGYGSTGPTALDSPEDTALLALYRAHRSLWNARRRWRQRRFREIPGYLLLAGRWRRAARRKV